MFTSNIFTRITKYKPIEGDVQDWGPLGYLRFLGSVKRAINFSRFLIWIGLIDIDGGNVVIPYTAEDGESKEFYENYVKIVERIADLEKSDG